MPRNLPALRSTLVFLSIVAGYFVSGTLGLSLAFVNASASPVWPPTGLAIAALMLAGPRFWPAVFAGAFLVNASNGVTPLTALLIAIGNTLEAVVGAAWVDRYARGVRAFENVGDVFRYVWFAAGLATILSATIGVAALLLTGFASLPTAWPVWSTWWLGDATGALIVGPLVVLWARRQPIRLEGRWLEVAALTLTAAVVHWVVFRPATARAHLPLEFLCVPPLVWAAFRFGQRAAVTVIAASSGVAVWSTLRGAGPFYRTDPNLSLLLVQCFMGTLAGLGLALAAAVDERRRASRAVVELNERLEAEVDERTAQLRAANEELTVHSARLADAQRVAAIGSWDWDPVADRVWWSEETYRILGVPRAAFAHTWSAFLDRVHASDRVTVERAMKRALDSAAPFEIEFRAVGGPGGEASIIQMRAQVHAVDGGKPLLSGTVHDVTQRRRAEEGRWRLIEEQSAREEAEKSNRTKDEFLAVLAHELRTPLHAISGWVHLLRHAKLDPAAAAQALETIERNTELQSHLINDLLDLSRINAGTIVLDRGPVDIVSVLSSAAQTLRPTAQQLGVQIVLDTGDRSVPLVGDRDRLEQIFCNVLSNAIKFSPQGGRVTATLTHSPAAVRVTVTDEGPGIDPEYIAHVFEPFWQLDSSTRRFHKGLGLGLAIVQRLVELHHGTVEAGNQPAGGAVITLTLPHEVAPQNVRPASWKPSAGEREGVSRILEGTRVLLVDDEPDARDVIGTILSLSGAEVRTADSAAEGLAQLSQRPFDVLISDLAMPGEDGYTFLRRVRLSPEPALRAIPAIALTAFSDQKRVRRAHEAGFAVCLSKPATPSELIEIVARLAATPSRMASAPQGTSTARTESDSSPAP